MNLLLQLLLIAFTSIITTLAKDVSPLMLGVALDENSATGALFHTDNPVFISPVILGEDYQAYPHDTFTSQGQITREHDGYYRHLSNGTLQRVPNDGHDNERATTILASALEKAVKKAQTETGILSRLGAVTFPRHFNASTQNALFAAAKAVEPAFIDPPRLLGGHQGAFLTYPDSGCFEDWGEYDNDTPGFDHVIVLERSQGVLSLMYGKVVFWGGGIMESNIKTVYLQNMSEVLTHVRETESWHDSKGVIIGGSFSTDEFGQFKQDMLEEIPELASRIKSTARGPHFVSAQGAACLARWHFHSTGVFWRFDQNVVAHDEL